MRLMDHLLFAAFTAALMANTAPAVLEAMAKVLP